MPKFLVKRERERVRVCVCTAVLVCVAFVRMFLNGSPNQNAQEQTCIFSGENSEFDLFGRFGV